MATKAQKKNEQQRHRPRIRKGDEVVIIAGKERGKRGRILRVDTVRNRVIVEGRNMLKRHTRPNPPQQPGGVVEREGPIHISNVMLWSDKEGRRSRAAIDRDADGNPLRVLKVEQKGKK